MQREVLQAIDYALFVSDETYKEYVEKFIELSRKQKKNSMKQPSAAGKSVSTMSTASGVEEEKK